MSAAVPLRQRSLATLVTVSLFGVAFETFLTRYFALALFSDYSYWIISMALLGYSVGGVLLALWPEYFERTREAWLSIIPPLLLGATVLAYATLRLDPFNPLKLQNQVLWKSQIPAVLAYYGGLFPVFLLAGMLIGLMFLTFQREIPVIYALDLLGAALGAALVLLALFFVHPYHLPVIGLALLAGLTLANAPGLFRAGPAWVAVAVLAVAAAVAGFGAWYMLSTSVLATPDFKPLHAILAIEGTKVERSVRSPSGYYLVVDDYTEFDDVNMTNNYSSLGIGAPPRSWGLYKDGTRIAPLLKAAPTDRSYITGSLGHFPYTIRPSSAVLLVGTSGGYRVIESGPGAVGLEQQRTMYSLVRDALDRAQVGRRMPLENASVFSYLRDRPARFDIIEVAWDFLNQDPTNRFSFTREAMGLYLRSLVPGGILLVPIDISEVTLYCLKMVETVLAALRGTGSSDPAGSLICYRSQWTCEIMASNRPFSPKDVAALRRWCGDRSFDTSWFPGIDPSRIQVWNDLPPVNYETGAVQTSATAQDALMQDLVRMIPGGIGVLPESRLFDLAPPTLDRPDFYSISRPLRIGELLPRAPILPVQEMSYLVNVVVLAQALVLAAIVLFLPMAARRRAPEQRIPGLRLRVILYFSALGVAFFFIELALIDRLSLLLESATSSFAVVLSAMLVFSGLGSWYTSRFTANPRRGLAGALALIVASVAFYLFALDPMLRLAVALPYVARVALVVVLVAPLSFGLGRPFALGTSELAGGFGHLIPWAWSINGALSVVATPVANLLSASVGWTAVLAIAGVLYVSIVFTFPRSRRFGVLASDHG